MTELYLYQTIHLYDRRPRLLNEHVRMLDEASKRCFGLGYAPDTEQLAARLRSMADDAGIPYGLSGFIRLELLPNGRERLSRPDVSLYGGYALRSIAPRAATIPYSLPDEAPTTAREAAALLACRLAEREGASAAVRCDHTGACLTADDAPLFAVHGHTVCTPLAPWSVERNLGIEAVRAAGLELIEAPIERASLSVFDELFYVDHRGVTALSSCDGHPYMDLIAGRTAEAMERLFRRG